MPEFLAQADSSTDPGTGAVSEPLPTPITEPVTTQTPAPAGPIVSTPAPQSGWTGYLPIVLGILAVGAGSYIFAKLNKKSEEKNEDKKCLNYKKLMEEKLNELTDLKSTLGDFAKSTSVAEIRKKVKNKDAKKVLDLAEKSEKEYLRLKKLYEECLIAPPAPTIINKVAWIVIKNRKVLFVRSAKGKGIFYTPGGKVNPGESDKKALMREMKEELSIDLKPETIEYLETFKDRAHNDPTGAFVEIKCYTSGFAGTLKPSGEIEEIAAFSTADRHRTAGVGQMLLDWLKREDLID